VTCRTLMVIAGGVPSERLNLDAFIKQANEYQEWDSNTDRVRRFFTELGLTHSYAVRRVSETISWVRSGDYDRILSGEYIRRGQEPGTREEADAATQHYAERFKGFFNDAADGVAKVGEQLTDATNKLSDWLKREKA